MSFWDGLGKEVLESLSLPEFDGYDKIVREVTMQQFADILKGLYPEIDKKRPFIERFSDRMRYYYMNVVTVKSGVYELLDKLKAEKMTLCLASATDKTLVLEALIHFDLMRYFDAVVTADDVGCGKRYRHIRRRLPRRTVG